MTLFVEVALPVPLTKTFTYRIPSELEGSVGKGSIVCCPFGSRLMNGVVWQISSSYEGTYEIRDILDVISSASCMNENLFRLCEWLSVYYCQPLGQVVEHAIFPGLKKVDYLLVQTNYLNLN